jgi:glycosyltransferase involved in cell wall biosynthesis
MSNPRVSIGMPVYNAENFLREAIESIRAQTFRDLEIVISDNCSTDRTPEICEEYAKTDSRIRYFRNPKNLGAGYNHTRVAELARGEFFKWQSRDDLCDHTFLERCVAVLDGDPAVVLCHSKTQLIDERGAIIGVYGRQLETDCDRPSVRFRELIWHDHKCYQIYGLMRLDTMRSVGGMPCCVGGDDVLLARLALAGRLHEIPELLFSSRQHSAQSGRTLPAHFGLHRRRLFPRAVGTLPPLDWWDPTRKGKVAFPEATLLRHYVSALFHARIGLRERAWSFLCLLPWMAKHAPRLMNDLKIAVDLICAPLLNYTNRANLSHEKGPTV